MFPKRIDISGHKRPDSNPTPWASWKLEPNLRENTLGLDDFSEDSLRAIDSINRKILIYTLSENVLIPGLKDGNYPIKFDVYNYSRNYRTPSPRKTKKATVSVKASNPTMETIVTFPNGRPLESMLRKIIQDKDGIPKVGKDLVNRARELDKEYMKNRGYFNYNDILLKYLDPEELAFISHMGSQFNLMDVNGFQINRYFNHMAQLTLGGYFADNINSRSLTAIRGLQHDGGHSILNSWTSPVVTLNKFDYNFPSEQRLKDFKKVLMNPWYKNPDLVQPINLDNVINAFDNLGRAHRAVYEHGTKTSVASIAVEAFVSELYTSLTGKKNGRGSSFVDKMKEISQKTDSAEYLQPFIDIYTTQDMVTPSKIRGGIIHTGNVGYEDKPNQLDTWTCLFYEDLAKTLISVIAGKPKAFYDFDAYCRNTGLCYGEDACATVSANIAQHYKHNKPRFKPIPKNPKR